MDEAQELIQEFLIESNENLAQLDSEFVELEQRPEDQDLLSSIFRTIHTIKGTCGFLGFSTLEAVTHRAENLLSQLREREKKLTPELTTLLLETVDVVKSILGRIEANGEEGSETYDALVEKLQQACDAPAAAQPAAAEPARAARKRRAPGKAKPQAESPAQTVEANSPPPPTAEAETLPESADPEIQAESFEPVEPEDAAVAAALPGSLVKGDGASARRSITDSTIRVDVVLLDKLMDLAGELVLSRNQILQHADSREDTALTATSQRLNLITTELQAAVMKTRMQPIGLVWNKFPRVVRDLAQSMGKQISLEMEGAETELDKTIIEAIKDPLTHLVRNSCDHGIEPPEERAAKGRPPGVIRLRAYHEGGQVNIEISDNGKGIDAGKLKAKALSLGLLTPEQAERLSEKELPGLVFLPGLSTAEKVTKVSGRGVGMDVVKTNIEKIGGSVDITSQPNVGTTVKVKIPLTLAIIPALMISSGSERYAIPQVNLIELVGLQGESCRTAIEWVHGSPVYRLRGRLLPLVYLNKILGANEQGGEPANALNIVVLQADDRTFGLVVDGVHDTQEIVVKPLSTALKGLNCYAGATIMGDGKVALILDAFGVAQSGNVIEEVGRHAQAAEEAVVEEISERQLILLFRSGMAERLGVPLSIVARLEEFTPEQIERAHGRSVIQYRGQILPLVRLADQLDLGQGSAADQALRGLQVVVFNDGGRRVGLIVDRILDVVQDSINATTRSERVGIVGSGVVDGRVTDFLDLQYLIETVDQQWFGQHVVQKSLGARVMLAEGSGFSRGILRNYLELNGIKVLEAASGAEALEKLARERVDVVLSSLDLPGLDGYQLLSRIRQEPAWARLPVIALSSAPQDAQGGPGQLSFDDFQLKFDREGTLRSIEKLAAALEQYKLAPQRS